MKKLLSLLIIFATFMSCTSPKGSIPQDAQSVKPLLIGDSIPDVSLQSAEGESINLTDFNRENTLFIFYRGGWCPFCSAELSEIAQIEDELYERGVTVIGISPDQPSYLQQSMDDIEFDYKLLSDSNMAASKAFGIAFQVDSETVQSLKENGMDIEERSGQNHHLLPVPAIFLTNDEGVIEFQYVNPEYRTRIDKDVLLAAVDAMINS